MNNYSHSEINQSMVSSDDHIIACEHPGDVEAREGPLWLFIHGIAACAAFWAPLMPATFSSQKKWVSASLPVHAPSRAPDEFHASDVTPELFTKVFGSVINHFHGDRPVIVVGHSTGGFAALCLAIERVTQIKCVVSVGGFADGHWTGLEGDMQLMARQEKFGVFGPSLLRGLSSLTTFFPGLHARVAATFAHDRQSFLAHPPTRVSLEHVRSAARNQNKDNMLSFFAGVRELDIWDKIHAVQQPVLILAGEYDPVIPAAQTARLYQSLPTAELINFAGTGHMIMNEAPERFWEELDHWPQLKILSSREPK